MGVSDTFLLPIPTSCTYPVDSVQSKHFYCTVSTYTIGDTIVQSPWHTLVEGTIIEPLHCGCHIAHYAHISVLDGKYHSVRIVEGSPIDS